MIIGIIIFFILIWIIIKAFSSNEKEVYVTKIDKETGNKTTEIRKEVSGSTGKKAAQTTLWIFVGIPVIFFIFLSFK